MISETSCCGTDAAFREREWLWAFSNGAAAAEMRM